MNGHYQRWDSRGNCWDIFWDEARNEIRLQGPDTKIPALFMNYDGARTVLDLLMAIFGRQELVYRYPEVR